MKTSDSRSKIVALRRVNLLEQSVRDEVVWFARKTRRKTVTVTDIKVHTFLRFDPDLDACTHAGKKEEVAVVVAHPGAVVDEGGSGGAVVGGEEEEEARG